MPLYRFWIQNCAWCGSSRACSRCLGLVEFFVETVAQRRQARQRETQNQTAGRVGMSFRAEATETVRPKIQLCSASTTQNLECPGRFDKATLVSLYRKLSNRWVSFYLGFLVACGNESSVINLRFANSESIQHIAKACGKHTVSKPFFAVLYNLESPRLILKFAFFQHNEFMRIGFFFVPMLSQ